MGRHVAQGGDLLLAPRAAGRAALRARQTCVLGLHCIAAPAKEVGRFCRHATGRTSARRRCRLGRADQDHGDDQQPAATDRIPDEVGQARRLQHGDHDTRGDQRGGRESPSQRARRAGSGGTRTAMIVRPSAAPTVRPGRAGGGGRARLPRGPRRPDGEGVAAEGGGAGDDESGELQGPVAGWELVGAACSGKPNAAAVRKNTNTSQAMARSQRQRPGCRTRRHPSCTGIPQRTGSISENSRLGR